MDRFQKLAVQMTKDDIKKGSVQPEEFRECRNSYMEIFKSDFEPYDIRDVIGFKNYNKQLSY